MFVAYVKKNGMMLLNWQDIVVLVSFMLNIVVQSVKKFLAVQQI
jgi:hypothetical protein